MQHEIHLPRNTRKQRRVGIMGGTFDPIHNGHLVAASEAAYVFSLDEVVFVPTGRPWHKNTRHREVSSSEDRYLMTVLATTSNPQFNVSRVDIERDKETYTVDTLHDLQQIYPEEELFFITGADALNSILGWQNWELLFDLAHFVGVSRPGFSVITGNLSRLPQERLSLVEVPAMAISSTDCRYRAAHHLPLWYLMPDVVVRYIAKHKLYLSE